MMNFHGLKMNMVPVDGGRVKRKVEEVMILKLGLCSCVLEKRLIHRPSEGKKRRRGGGVDRVFKAEMRMMFILEEKVRVRVSLRMMGRSRVLDE